MSQDADRTRLKALINEIEQDIENPPAISDQQIPIIKAKLYRTSLDNTDFRWVVELQTLAEPDMEGEYGDVPVNVSISGDVPVGDDAPEDTDEALTIIPKGK